MTSTKMRAYLRSHVLGLVAIFIALSGSAIAANNVATTSVVTDAKFKKLKKSVNALKAQLAAPATGDLTGTFPNLQIGPNAVNTAEIADDAVTTSEVRTNAIGSDELAADVVGSSELIDGSVGSGEIADGSVGQAEVANFAVGAGELKDTVDQGGGGFTSVTSGTDSGRLNASCDAGEQALSWGGVWDSQDIDDSAMVEGFVGPLSSTVQAANNEGVAHGFEPRVVCLDG